LAQHYELPLSARDLGQIMQDISVVTLKMRRDDADDLRAGKV